MVHDPGEQVPAKGYLDQRGQCFMTCDLCGTHTRKFRTPQTAVGHMRTHLATEHDLSAPDDWTPGFFDR